MAVTIAIPFYNAEKYLLSAIKSVMAQTHKDWELLLIDDGSTDDSLSIACSIKDPRVRVISDGNNKKLAARLNQVIDIAQYDLIARMDADDLMAPDRVAKQVAFLDMHPDFDVVCSGLISIDDNNTIIGERIDADTPISTQSLLVKNIIVHPSIMARKEWYKRNRYDEKFRLAQDNELWLRALKNNDFRIYYYPEALYYYRENESLTIRKTYKYVQWECNLVKRYAEGRCYRYYLRICMKFILKSGLILLGLKRMIANRRTCELKISNAQEINENMLSIYSFSIK